MEIEIEIIPGRKVFDPVPTSFKGHAVLFLFPFEKADQSIDLCDEIGNHQDQEPQQESIGIDHPQDVDLPPTAFVPDTSMKGSLHFSNIGKEDKNFHLPSHPLSGIN